MEFQRASSSAGLGLRGSLEFMLLDQSTQAFRSNQEWERHAPSVDPCWECVPIMTQGSIPVPSCLLPAIFFASTLQKE